MAPLRNAARHLARQRHHLPPKVLHRGAGGDHRAGRLRRLHHQHPDRHPGDDPVAARERAGPRRHPRREFAHQGAARGHHLLEELQVLRWIAVPQTGPGDDDRPPAHLEGRPVGRAIDAPGPPAHDRQPPQRELRRQLPRLPGAVERGLAAPDDRHGPRISRDQRSPHGEGERRVRRAGEEGRVVRVTQEDHPRPARLQGRPLRRRIHAGQGPEDPCAIQHSSAGAGHGHLGARPRHAQVTLPLAGQLLLEHDHPLRVGGLPAIERPLPHLEFHHGWRQAALDRDACRDGRDVGFDGGEIGMLVHRTADGLGHRQRWRSRLGGGRRHRQQEG